MKWIYLGTIDLLKPNNPLLLKTSANRLADNRCGGIYSVNAQDNTNSNYLADFTKKLNSILSFTPWVEQLSY